MVWNSKMHLRVKKKLRNINHNTPIYKKKYKLLHTLILNIYYFKIFNVSKYKQN